MNLRLEAKDVMKINQYAVCLLLILLVMGCSKKIAPQHTAQEETENNKTGHGASNHVLLIDTLLQSMTSRVASLPVTDSYFSPKVKESTRAFYSASNQTKWLGNVAPTELFYAFTNNVKQSDQYGLRPDDYAITSIEESVKSLYASSPIDSSAIIKLDIGITSMFFLFSSHLVEGRLQKAGHGSKIWIRENSKTTDLVAILFGIDKPEKLREAMNHLQPVHEQYAKLLQALDQYRYLDKVSPQIEGAIAVTGKIQPNDHHAAIPLIRDRISYTDMRPDSLMRDSLRYDEALVSAVKWFQLRHGLEPDGIIGAGTLKFLNQSFKEKADIIALNLERLRWIPETYGDNYIVVNLPEYKMSVFEDKKFALEMKVIVGSAETPTPVFADTLRHIVFSPTWSVPTSIIKNEIIPRLQRDSSYYSSKNYVFYKGGVRIDPANEIWRDQTINPYSLSVVQQPGPDNSLGLVKFVMPNHMNIYLHDTPGQRLFKRSYRALSHGCIRLDEPAELAEFLLKDQRGWDEEAIAKAMRGEQPATLFIKKMYRVQLEYYTAWVDENGLVNFREDIYGHDKYQLALLNPKKKQTKEEVNIIDISGAGN